MTELHFVQLGAYSLEPNNVGKEWRPVLTKAFHSPKNAMIELNRLIESGGDGLRPTTYEILSNGVLRMSLNEFYRRTFGVNPVRRRDGSYGYPKLK